jgi:predicted HNH restriction endonuclease
LKTGPIELEEIITALRLLGGQAQAKYIKDKVTELRGGMPEHYGRSHSYRETIQKKIEDHCPQSENWKESNEPYFERVKRGVYRLIEKGSSEQLLDNALINQISADLEAIADEESGLEGGKKARLISYYERNPALRAAAIAFHGTSCKACGFNFEVRYGKHGKNYIEVHHLIPVSTLLEPSSINPKKDLTVLCSNCHRMIHRKQDLPLSIEELRILLTFGDSFVDL